MHCAIGEAGLGETSSWKLFKRGELLSSGSGCARYGVCAYGAAPIQARWAYLQRGQCSARFQQMNLRTQHKHSEKSKLPRAWVQQACFGSRAQGGEGAESADLP